METLHIRTEEKCIEVLIDLVNKISKEGNQIEILDNTLYDKEQKMIFQSLLDEKNGNIYNHEELWDELLK